jgi:D-amino-acid dehydrogenase
MTAPDVIVVGGGIVGLCCAADLARAGARVELLERANGVGEGASWGNAGLFAPSHARPIAAPESVRLGVRWMLRRDAPFGLRPRPSLAPWLVRFLRASTRARAEAGELLQRQLCMESIGVMRELVGDGIDVGFRQEGCLTVHTAADGEQRAAAEAASPAGVAQGARLLSAGEARALEPALTDAVRAGVLLPHEATCDPVRFSAAMAELGRTHGVTVRTGVEVHGLRADRGGGESAGVTVATTRGERRAGHVVVAAGAWTGRLAATLGVTLPLQGGKGYAVEWDLPAAPMRLPLYLHDERCVTNPLGDRLRITGGLLLDGLDERFEPRRTLPIERAAANVLGVRTRPRLTWRGLRPCTPDGLPVVGAHGRVPRAIFATGHGMLGVTLAPLTGRMVAGVVAGDPPHAALARLSPERF